MPTIEAKKQSVAELRIDKAFSMHDYYACRECKHRRKDIDVDVSTNPKITKPIPTLVLADNAPNLLVVRKACINLTATCS